MEELAVKFKDKQFLMKLAYLSDIFGKLNDVNLQLQGRDKHIPHLADKISSFTRKLDVWNKHLERENTDSFEDLSAFTEMNDLDTTTVIGCLREHISSLGGFSQKYFPDSSAKYDCVRDPFNAVAPADFSSEVKYRLIAATSIVRVQRPEPNNLFLRSFQQKYNHHTSFQMPALIFVLLPNIYFIVV